jgi:hypothetical protein
MLIEVFNGNVNSRFTNISEQFDSPVFFVKATKIGNLERQQCGLLHLHIEHEQLENVRLLSKKVLLNQTHLIRFDRLNFPFSLVFEKLKVFGEINLQIYRETMPIEFEPQQQSNKGSTTGGTPVNTSAVSVVLLAANSNRKSSRIVNTSNRDLYIHFGATASLAAYTAKLPKLLANGIPSAFNDDSYTGVISGIWESAGSGNAQVIEILP